MTGADTIAQLARSWARQHPGKAAKGALVLLASDDVGERARGHELAAALRREDRCAVCGKQLRNDESKRIGIGTDCRAKRRAEAKRALAALRDAGFDVLDPAELGGDAP